MEGKSADDGADCFVGVDVGAGGEGACPGDIAMAVRVERVDARLDARSPNHPPASPPSLS